MDDPKVIKKFEQIGCPHCGQNIIIGTQSMMSSVVSINKIEDIQKAKNSVMKRLGEVKFHDEKDKVEIIKWLNDDATLIDNSDVEHLLRQIAIEQINKEKVAV